MVLHWIFLQSQYNVVPPPLVYLNMLIEIMHSYPLALFSTNVYQKGKLFYWPFPETLNLQHLSLCHVFLLYTHYTQPTPNPNFLHYKNCCRFWYSNSKSFTEQNKCFFFYFQYEHLNMVMYQCPIGHIYNSVYEI